MTEKYVPIVHQQALSPEPFKEFDGFMPHEWRNYVDGDLRDMWNSFTEQQKIAIADNAQRIADQEERD